MASFSLVPVLVLASLAPPPEDDPVAVPADVWGLELGVSDPEVSERFYVELLGFERLSDPGAPAVVLAKDGLHLVLSRSTEPAPGPEVARCYPNFSVGDLDGIAEGALMLGGTADLAAVRTSAVGPSLEILDPDGHPFHAIDHPWDELGSTDPPALFNVGLRVLAVEPWEPWLTRLGIPVGNRAYLPQTLVMEPHGAAQLVVHPTASREGEPGIDGGRLILVSRVTVPDAGLLPGLERVVPGLGGADRFLLRGPSGVSVMLFADPPVPR